MNIPIWLTKYTLTDEYAVNYSNTCVVLVILDYQNLLITYAKTHLKMHLFYFKTVNSYF